MTEMQAAGVGAQLADARQAQGLSVADAARQLKFAARQIEALEQERFDALPGGTFARGMVRAYARLLKLDADSLLERLGDRFERPDADQLAARFKQPVPFSNGARRLNLIYLGLSLAILGIAGAVAYEWRHEPAAGGGRMTFVNPAKRPTQAPTAVVAGEPAPSAPATNKPATSTPAASAPAASAPVSKPAVASAAPRPVVAESRPAPLPRAAPTEDGRQRIVIRCDEESWVEIRDATGRSLIAQLNPAGSVRTVQGTPPFELVIGNAQHVRLDYAGKPVDLRPHVRVEVARLTLE